MMLKYLLFIGIITIIFTGRAGFIPIFQWEESNPLNRRSPVTLNEVQILIPLLAKDVDEDGTMGEIEVLEKNLQVLSLAEIQDIDSFTPVAFLLPTKLIRKDRESSPLTILCKYNLISSLENNHRAYRPLTPGPEYAFNITENRKHLNFDEEDENPMYLQPNKKINCNS